MKPKYYFPFLLFPFLLFSSCSDSGDCFKGTGKIIEEERTLEYFSAVHTSDNIEVIFTNNPGNTIRVKAGENIISKIKTKVSGGILYITNENKCNWVRSYKKELLIYIGIQNIKDVFNYGSGSFESEWLTKDTLYFHHYGSGNVHMKLNSNLLWMDIDKLGDFTIEGATKAFNAHSYSLGQIKAQGFIAETIWLTNEGQGNCYVNANKTLGVTIKNDGNVYYSGIPQNIELSKQGKGNLIKN